MSWSFIDGTNGSLLAIVALAWQTNKTNIMNEVGCIFGTDNAFSLGAHAAGVHRCSKLREEIPYWISCCDTSGDILLPSLK